MHLIVAHWLRDDDYLVIYSPLSRFLEGALYKYRELIRNEYKSRVVSWGFICVQAIERLRDVYNGSLNLVDPYPAGLMEATPHSIGPLFTAVILEQFLRIRDGDRFWFENSANK